MLISLGNFLNNNRKQKCFTETIGAPECLTNVGNCGESGKAKKKKSFETKSTHKISSLLPDTKYIFLIVYNLNFVQNIDMDKIAGISIRKFVKVCRVEFVKSGRGFFLGNPDEWDYSFQTKKFNLREKLVSLSFDVIVLFMMLGTLAVLFY